MSPASQPCVLIVDDDESILTVLRMRLKAGGYRVLTAHDRAEAIQALGNDRPDVVVSDLRLETEDGLDVMDALHEIDSGLPVLILTAHGSIPNAVEAIKRGAAGYLTKPVDKDELFAQLGRCLQTRRLTDEVNVLRRAIEERSELQGIVGSSAGMRMVFELIERMAPTRITVCIQGESGTGKELVARAIHRLSPRANRQFLAINCAAMPEGLLSSELFGHKKGAFTGASSDRDGLFRQADGGTLFLDEIGEMSPGLQASLLRALQEGEVMPVGGRAPIKVDVRVIVATNRDLKQAVADGQFREDLYYRVNVAPIHLPPLRDREADLELLADHFLARLSKRHKRPGLRFSPAAMDVLRGHGWPGNVRELEHAIERGIVMCAGDQIGPDDLFPGGGAHGGAPSGTSLRPLREARDAWEREYLVQLLKSTGGNVSAAARSAGKYRADLYAMLHKHDIDPADFKTS